MSLWEWLGGGVTKSKGRQIDESGNVVQRRERNGKEERKKYVTGARVNWAHAPFLHLHPQLPVPSLSLSTTFVSAGAFIIKITSSLFITTVVKQLRLASSPMEDGVSVQGPATCRIQREGSSSYTPLFTAHRPQSCVLSKQSQQLSLMFHLNRLA